MNLLFYVAASSLETPEVSLKPGCRVEIWRPTYRKPVPPGQQWYPFLLFWLFHKARVFANEDYGVVLIWEGDRLVHRTLVLPRYFRFPFMGPEDLQIALTWTDRSCRGKGLALAAARKVMAEYGRGARKLWYMVQARNKPSIRVAEKAGFRLYATGSRRPRFGCEFLGAYTLDEPHAAVERVDRQQGVAQRVTPLALSMVRLLAFSPFLLGAALIARLRQGRRPRQRAAMVKPW